MMSQENIPSFDDFFNALWGYAPFPWQTMLAEKIAQGFWPQALDLPTAAGKTACMDAAIYALATQADWPLEDRTAPRRIWFVVDRRIVVDAAYERAKSIAGKLQEAYSGPLQIIAERLKKLSGTERSLVAARLRGGILQDEGWGRLPSQPAIISSTVDQLGSKLLFRGYGRSSQTASIFAGLAANDSLILLDEAHCSLPFHQTLRAISTYRGEKWAEERIPTPFAYAILSATPPSEDGVVLDVFPGKERNKALDSDVLQKRLQAHKLAELHELAKTKKDSDKDVLIDAAKKQVSDYLKIRKKRIAVIVNRIHTAEEIYRALTEGDKEQNGKMQAILLTGRMRPYDRDQLMGFWEKYLRASSPEDYEKPICLVSTQCIEVGADFSFDALVTECASLDALKQRFGRLNRMGLPGDSPAAIFIRSEDIKEQYDPIYGAVLAKTWNLMLENATLNGSGKKATKVIDFGFEPLRALLEKVDNLEQYAAPHLDAPVLFPAYLDLLCQTSPQPQYEPEIGMFLHGKGRSAPEARVLWRCDLPKDDENAWKEIVSMCPPVGGEMLSVPLYRLRQWLASKNNDKNLMATDSDLEGSVVEDGNEKRPIRSFLFWCGRKNERTRVFKNAQDIHPDDVIIIPVYYGINGLGQTTDASLRDIWEQAYSHTGRGTALRIQKEVLDQKCSPLKALCEAAQLEDWDKEMILDLLQQANEYKPKGDSVAIPEWIVEILKDLPLNSPSKIRIENYPGNGLLVSARSAQNVKNAEQELDLFADQDDLTSTVLVEDQETVSLNAHIQSVQAAAERLAKLCLPQDFQGSISTAALWHDAGKMDERFQLMLRHGDELSFGDEALAKSKDIPLSPRRRKHIQEISGLPEYFRHEMLSTQLAERFGSLDERIDSNLVLHLIASHHGNARPFAPVCEDNVSQEITGNLNNHAIQVSTEERKKWPPLHRVDSDVADRFWQLNRRYGWWGLAYLEAVLRLADWYGSAHIIESNHSEEVNS